MRAPLTTAQLDAIRRIQSAMVNIERLRRRINEANEANGLGLSLFSIPQSGTLSHQIDGLLFDHDLAVAKRADELGHSLEAAA